MLHYALQIFGTEWIWIVFLIIFLLFGSKKLPELSRALGKAMSEFQRGREEIEREFRAAAAPIHTLPKDLRPEHKVGSLPVKTPDDTVSERKGKSSEDARKEVLDDQGGKKSEGKKKTNTEPEV